MSLVVTDNGTPNLSATQSFNIFVTRPAHPKLQSTSLAGGTFQFQIYGDAGPDYTIHASTNLVNWTSLGTTITGDGLTKELTDPIAGIPARFYRLRLD